MDAQSHSELGSAAGSHGDARTPRNANEPENKMALGNGHLRPVCLHGFANLSEQELLRSADLLGSVVLPDADPEVTWKRQLTERNSSTCNLDSFYSVPLRKHENVVFLSQPSMFSPPTLSHALRIVFLNSSLLGCPSYFFKP